MSKAFDSATTFNGKQCPKCLGTLRYKKGKQRCQPCTLANNAARIALDKDAHNIRMQPYRKKYLAANKDRLNSEARAKHYWGIDKGLAKGAAEAMLLSQDGKCQVCEMLVSPGRFTHIDHCHDSGIVRGILCQHCNIMLGQSRDNPAILQAGIDYLARHDPLGW